MLKHLAILAVLLTIVQAPIPVPRQAADSATQTSRADQKQGQKTQTDSRLATPTIPQSSEGPSQQGAGKEHSNDKSNPITISKLPPVSISRDWADWAIWVFDGLLVGVGIAQIVLMSRTWKAIFRQANLQEFLTRQWVDIGNWRVIGCDPRSDPTWETKSDPFREPLEDETLKKSMEISLGLEIFNNGSYPLTINRIAAGISNGARGKTRRDFSIGTQILLPPHKDGAENSHRCHIPITLNASEVRNYYKTTFVFQVWIEVVLLNAEGIPQPQNFHRWAGGGLKGFLFEKDVPQRLLSQDDE
jgi:hypothetical protein